MGVNTNTITEGSTTDDSSTDVTITGTTGNDVLTIDANTSSVWAGTGTDAVVFSGDFSDYTYGQSDSFVPFIKHASTDKTVSLYDVEELEFNGVLYDLSNNGNGEFRVNTETYSDQSNSNVISLNNGGFFVTWTSYNQDGSGNGVYAQRYDSYGNAVNDEFKVNSYTSGSQSNPNVIQLNDGSIVITWDSSNQDGSSTGVYAKRYDADGQAVFGSEFKVNTYTLSEQLSPSVTALNDSGFVVTWQSDAQEETYGYSIYAQRYDVNGDASGDEFQVNTTTLYGQSSPSVTALNDGGFVVTWQSTVLYNSSNEWDYNDEIYAQRYDVNGNTSGDEFQVNTYTSSDQSYPSVTALNDGGFVVTWQSDGQDGSGVGIYAQRYDVSGDASGDEFRVNTYISISQKSPSVTALNDGGFVVTWQSDGQDGDAGEIYAQRYDGNGNTSGDEFQVNTTTLYNQSYPSVTALNDGGFVVTWQSDGQDGSGVGIYAQRYDVNGNRLGDTSIVSLNKLIGTTNDDILQGDDGIDHISTLEGADLVRAEMSDDIITLAADGVWDSGHVAENMAWDDYIATGEKISLDGFNQFNDVIYAGSGIDTIILTDGSDAFFLDNIYTAHHSSLTLESTTRGVDSTKRVNEIEIINAGDGDDIVDLTSDYWNSSTSTTINGGAGNDTLWGSNAVDTINGGAGNDTIFSGGGADILTGGSGSDIFQFTASDNAAGGENVITDFNITEDSIKLYYRTEDRHTYDDISILNGILSWDASDEYRAVLIDMSSSIVSSDLSNIPDLSIIFVEIV